MELYSSAYKKLLLRQQEHLAALMALNKQLIEALFETSGKHDGRMPMPNEHGRMGRAKKSRPSRHPRARAHWFARGEVLALAKSLLKSPMRPVQLVRAIGEAKGLNGNLDSDQRKRFEATTYQSLLNAVENKTLFRTKDGLFASSR